jgi:N-alpha-acetyl-L-2,4-diaminobutyrate deacetylase
MAMSCTIPLDRDGAFHGVLRLPYSRDDSAWGAVVLPVSVIGRGSGPVALFTAGNHGDEYEGQIALRELAATLDPAQMRGRVIILPAMNGPAVRAGTRTSPIDKVNMNRAYPGRADGTVTQKIAHYIASDLVPRADLVLDYHSGGKTLDFLPFAAAHRLPDAAQSAACLAAVQAFGAPWSMVMTELDAKGMFDTEVEEQGKVFVTTELGGGGTATPESVAIARRGARNLLIHMGILDEPPAQMPTRWLDMPDDCFVIAETAGICEPVAGLGATVEQGEAIARIWPLGRMGDPPAICRAPRAGLIAARHFPGLIQEGDCLAVVATETARP